MNNNNNNNNNVILYGFAAVLIGAGGTFQVALNSYLAIQADSQVFGALMNFVVGGMWILFMLMSYGGASLIAYQFSTRTLRNLEKISPTSASAKAAKANFSGDKIGNNGNDNDNDNNGNDDDDSKHRKNHYDVNDNKEIIVKDDENDDVELQFVTQHANTTSNDNLIVSSNLISQINDNNDNDSDKNNIHGKSKNEIYAVGWKEIFIVKAKKYYRMAKSALIWKDGRLKQAPWYSFCGGLCGATLVFLGVMLVPRIGLALNFTARIAGTLITSSVFDHFGFLGFKKRRLSFARLSGLILVLTGCIIFQFAPTSTTSTKPKSTTKTSISTTVFLSFVALFSGSLMPLQSSINRTLSTYCGNAVISAKIIPLRSALISFFGGLSSLFCVYIILLISGKDHTNVRNTEFWQYFAGCIGAMYVSAGVLIPAKIGVAAFFVYMVVGQMIMGLTLDAIGIFGAPKKNITVLRVFAALLVVTGSLLVQIFPRSLTTQQQSNSIASSTSTTNTTHETVTVDTTTAATATTKTVTNIGDATSAANISNPIQSTLHSDNIENNGKRSNNNNNNNDDDDDDEIFVERPRAVKIY